MAPQPISVFIGDSQPLFRYGLRHLLEAEPTLRVVGEAANPEDLTKRLGQVAVDVLFLDATLSGPTSTLLREIVSAWPDTHVVIVTAAGSDTEMIAALELGVRGIVPRDAGIDLFPKCARAVFSGQYWVGQQAVAGLVDSLRRAKTRESRPPGNHLKLTARQLAVVRAVATSQTNREIATQLGISEDTVKQHLTAIFDKCGVSNRVELALFSVRHNLLD